MTNSTVRYWGSIADLSDADRSRLCNRTAARDPEVVESTAAIIRRVRAEGDSALIALAALLDRVKIDSLEVPKKIWRRSLDSLDRQIRLALERAINNLTTVHEAFRPTASEIVPEPGILVGRRPDPLDRIGLYAPGGRAAYPSSLLMGAIPARVAGVREIIACSPPADDGLPSRLVLAAAELAGVDRLYRIGGAGAIAAMAYGTESIPAVDRIVGPGNIWVAEAKSQVAGQVPIDAPAGPSELLVLADNDSSPEAIVREILAQAEHDPEAAVAVVIIGGSIDSVAAELPAAVAAAPKGAVIAASLRKHGALLSAASVDDAVKFANEYAAEHLLLLMRDSALVLPKLRNAGTVFVGESSSVAFGDYLTGANHVLPTGGAGRRWSGLSVGDFYRWTTWQRVDRAAAQRLATDTATLAAAEGLPSHAAAAGYWRQG